MDRIETELKAVQILDLDENQQYTVSFFFQKYEMRVCNMLMLRGAEIAPPLRPSMAILFQERKLAHRCNFIKVLGWQHCVSYA